MKKPIKPTVPVPPKKPNKASLEEVRVEMVMNYDLSLATLIAKAKELGVPEDQFSKLTYEKGRDDSYNTEDSIFSGYINKEVPDAEYEKRMIAYDLSLIEFGKKLATYKAEKVRYDVDIWAYEQETLKDRLNKEAEELVRLEKLLNP